MLKEWGMHFTVFERAYIRICIYVDVYIYIYMYMYICI
jgi:hypothetical protein